MRSSTIECPTASENAAFSRHGAAEEIFALAVAIELSFGVDAHHIFHEIEVAEGYARLHGMDGDTAVGAQDVVHMELSDALLRFLLKLRGVRGKVGILIAEELVGNFPRQKHAHVRRAVDGFA